MAVILVSCLFSYGVMTSSLFSGRPLHLVTVKEDGFRCLFPVESLLLLIFTMLIVLMTITMTTHHVGVKRAIYIYFVAIGFIKK